VWALGRIRDGRGFDSLLIALNDKSANVRRAAAESLGQMADPRAIEPLKACINDSDKGVTEAVRNSLRMLGV
jgi:HEAT repeat protein